MDALIAIILALALTLPLRTLVLRVIDHADSPEYYRRHGVIVRCVEALDHTGEALGQYRGVPIYRSVGFKGMRYEFEGVVPPAYKQHVRRWQLFLEPGLLYLDAPPRAGLGHTRAQ